MLAGSGIMESNNGLLFNILWRLGSRNGKLGRLSDPMYSVCESIKEWNTPGWGQKLAPFLSCEGEE